MHTAPHHALDQRMECSGPGHICLQHMVSVSAPATVLLRSKVASRMHYMRQAALYAVMCGHVGRILPVCRGWEDTTWAFLRSWLDAAVDDRLRERLPAIRP